MSTGVRLAFSTSQVRGVAVEMRAIARKRFADADVPTTLPRIAGNCSPRTRF